MSTWKEKEEEARRRHILDVAERLFAEKGLLETSVSDIAREAECGVGTLYKYFSDRNTLIESLLADRLTAHHSALENAMNADLSPPLLVERLVEAYLQSVADRAGFFRMYFTHFHPGTERHCGECAQTDDAEEHKRVMFARLDEIFERGINEGCFADPGEPQYLSTALFGMLMSFYFLAEFRFNGKIDVPGFKTAILKIFFEQTLLCKDKER